MFGVFFLGLLNKNSHEASPSPPLLSHSRIPGILILPSLLLSFVHSLCSLEVTATVFPQCLSLESTSRSVKADGNYCKLVPCWPTTSYPNYLLKSHPTIPCFLHIIRPYRLLPCSSFTPPSGYPTCSSLA